MERNEIRTAHVFHLPLPAVYNSMRQLQAARLPLTILAAASREKSDSTKQDPEHKLLF